MDASATAHPSDEIEAAAHGLALHLRRASKVVVLTGAGMSTECGIPDFRSPGSPWLKNPPMPFDQFLASEEARREAWRRKFALDDHHKGAAPGAGHLALARLVHQDIVETVITQNIDNMHQNAGVPAEKVIELHGNGTYARCLDCGRRHELVSCRRVLEWEHRAPRCEACGGIVKSATISFGQAMPADEMRRATLAANGADLMLAIGSSLVVYPAAGLPLLARDNGAVFLILNRGETGLDEEAAERFDVEAGPVLGRLAALLARRVN
ncbi:MAG: NAD-dependent deacetylase [Hyphomicrobiales bacterium]